MTFGKNIYREHDAIKTLKPLAEKSLEQLHRIIHVSLKKAVIDNKIYRNPADLVRCPKSKNHNHIILSPDEAIEILQKLSDTDVYIPVLLAIIMGLRRGEMLGLRWSDIDFSTNTLSVNRNRLGIGAKETVTSPKTPKSKRILYMPQMAISALKKFKISSKPNIAENPDKYVCVDSYGIPFKANYFTNQYKKALANHGIQPMRYHDLRHSCVALLIAAGAVPKEISDYLGHSEIGITMDLYGDLFDEYKKNSKGYGFHNIFSSI